MSEGMLCSSRELHVADIHTGILILEPGLALGTDVATHFGLRGAVLDIEIEPDRPDLMSVLGVAREVAALTGVPLVDPPTELAVAAQEASSVLALDVGEAEACPQYLARIIRGITVGPSPVAAQARLTAAGMRPISNVIDATNYVLLERGHPLHPFDLSLLSGATILVRAADDGETIQTLDGIERDLVAEDLVIADAEKAIAVAGVMGLVAAEVSEATVDVALEAAYFQPTGILRTARRLGLSTEASQRFERGTDPEGVRRAADRTSALIVAWSGGVVLEGVLQAGGVPERRWLSVRPSRAEAVLGEAGLTAQEVQRRLRLLGFATEATSDAEISVEVPGYRVDLHREIDLIGELVRIERGYERVVATLPRVAQTGGFPDAYAFRRRVSELLVRAGFHELRSLSFASADDLALMGDDPEAAVAIANPLQADEGWLRTRLTPGLLRALVHNRAHSVATSAVFELGTTFRAVPDDAPDAPGFREIAKVGFALTGPASMTWAEPERPLDLFDAKGALEALLEGLGISSWSLGEAAPMPFHPGRSARVEIGGVHAGDVGELHPRIARDLDLQERVAICVLGMSPLMAAVPAELDVRDVPRFPPSRRDLAFVVGAETPVDALHRALMEAGGLHTARAVLFDLFTGSPLEDGKKSVAFAVEFRNPERTLTDADTEEAVAAIAQRLAREFDAELRS